MAGRARRRETYGWFNWIYKIYSLAWTLRDQSEALDLACLAAALILIYDGVRSRSFERDPALVRAALVLLAAVFVIPYQLFGSAYADARLWPLVLMLALLALRPAPTAPRRLSPMIAAGAAALFGLRIAVTTVGFQGYDADYRRHLAAVAYMKPGEHVALFVALPARVSWRRPRLEHLDGIAIVRRDVFTNGQWEVPGAQLLVPLGARGTLFNADPSQYVMEPGDSRPQLAFRIAHFPRKYFELAWVIGYRPETLPRYSGLTPLFADDNSILYRIER